MVTGFNDVESQLINAVINAPSAWQTPENLADSLQWTLEATLDAIADLDAAGWLEGWELAEGPVVTLSVRGSVRLGVRLVEVGVDETPRWARAGELDPVARRAAGVFRSERMACLDLVVDDRPSVEQALILGEELDQAALVPRGDGSGRPEPQGPRPTLLIGTGLTPWPGPAEATDAECPACRSAHLPSHAYCLRCDRSGRDASGSAAGSPADQSLPVPMTPTAPSRKNQIRQRERERERRQAKRQRRRAQQAKLGPSSFRPIVPLWMAPVAG